jgi:OOP family OmpA-OmpF porin
VLRKLLFAALIAATGYVCFDLGQRGARAYEQMLAMRVSNGLDVLGFSWARVEADGLRLSIYGHAPDTFARDLALESARATAPLARVVSYATATLAPPEHRNPVRVELLRDERGVTLTGQTASRAMRERLNEALAADGPGIAVQDLTGIQAAPPPRGWGPEVGAASLAASRLPNAYVVMEPGQVSIEGQAADEADRKALTQALLDRAGDRVSLILDIRIPARVIAPFAFSAWRDAGAGIRLERCAARSYEEQALLMDRLKSLAVEHQPDPCPVGLGGPGGEWPAAVSAALSALARLPAGRVDIEYRDARLIAGPPSSPPDFEAALADFREALPEGFTVAGELRTDDVATRTGIARERFWMHLRRTAENVVLSGQVPDRAARMAIETEARALYGTDGVASALDVVGAAPPVGWQVAALRLLSAMTELPDGEGRLAGYRASLRGTIDRPGDARELHDRIVAELPGFEVTTAFRLDLPAALARVPLPPLRCAAELNRVNRGPAIDFAPGSAVITEASGSVLDRLAGILNRCAGAPIEIGGHTDAQGSKDLNLRLSQARAEAVFQALVGRGVPPDRLVARGFGEEVPIASNETDAGRARNRRIEFEPAG